MKSLLPLLLLARVAAGQGAEVAGDTYRAVVAPEGHLLSVHVGATELLDPVRADSRGGVLCGLLPLTLEATRYTEDLVTFRGEPAAVSYRFQPDRLAITVANATDAVLTYRLALASAWTTEGATARTPWGAAAEIVGGSPRALRDGFEIACRPLATTTFAVRLDRSGIADRPFEQSVSVVPRSLRPWAFVLRGSPPDVDADGTMMTIPLLTGSDLSEPAEATIEAALVDGDGHEQGRQVQPVTLPARDLVAVDVRVPPPAPGTYRLAVDVVRGTDRHHADLVVAFAPEQWPVAEAPAPTEPPSTETRLHPEPVAGLPEGWGRFSIDADGARAVMVAPLTADAPTVLLFGWAAEPPALWARLGLASILGDEAAARLLPGNLLPGPGERYGLALRRPGLAELAWAAGRRTPVLAVFEPAGGLEAERHEALLIGQVVAPGARRRAWRGPAERVTQWLYTIRPDVAESHFRAAQRAWLAERLAP